MTSVNPAPAYWIRTYLVLCWYSLRSTLAQGISCIYTRWLGNFHRLLHSSFVEVRALHYNLMPILIAASTHKPLYGSQCIVSRQVAVCYPNMLNEIASNYKNRLKPDVGLRFIRCQLFLEKSCDYAFWKHSTFPYFDWETRISKDVDNGPFCCQATVMLMAHNACIIFVMHTSAKACTRLCVTRLCNHLLTCVTYCAISPTWTAHPVILADVCLTLIPRSSI